MREIKLRVWNKARTDFTIISLNHTGWINITEETNGGIDEFIGLLDKNKKEIYEGDIVVWHDNTENKDVGWSRTAIVKIDPDLYFYCFKIGNDFDKDIKFHYGNFIWTETEKYFEVIGNIYENKDLNWFDKGKNEVIKNLDKLKIN